jgi:hypothetical protein
MSSWVYRAGSVAIAALAALVACSDDDTTGTGGAGAAGAQGGMGGDSGCVPAECPQPPPGEECKVAICVDDACGMGDVAAGTACDGGTCDGEGHCVDHCGNGVQDADETDVDCGGACPSCALGEGCIVEGDCTSGFCIDLVCCQTACDGACEGCDLDGTVGVCTPHPAGTDPDNDCAPMTCDGNGACLERP